MKHARRRLALLLALLLCAAGCGKDPAPAGPSGEAEQPSASQPAETVEPTETPEEPEEPSPAVSEPPENCSLPFEVEAGLTVDGGEIRAVRRYSALGYSLVYPPDEVTLNDWGEGETYEITDAPGTYLAVSRVGGSSISEAVAGLQFEYAIEDEPTGVMFGAEGYAGVRMVTTAGGLTAEYILYQGADGIYLVEHALFTGGEDYAELLQAMLDSFAVEDTEQ